MRGRRGRRGRKYIEGLGGGEPLKGGFRAASEAEPVLDLSEALSEATSYGGGDFVTNAAKRKVARRHFVPRATCRILGCILFF